MTEDVAQKLSEEFSFLISIVVPSLSKKFLTFLFGGKIGTGPFLNDIGGKGIALTIVAFTLMYLFKSSIFIVEIKLTIICFFLKLNFFIILFPTFGVTAKNTQSDLLIIS